MPKLPASDSDELVREFLELWGLQGPVYLDYLDVGKEYEPNFCHVSAKHIVLERGGKRVHGWALWQFAPPTGTEGHPVLVADFHSVWESPEGDIIDVTPPKAGSRVLFVRDPSLKIAETGNSQILYHNRTNMHEAPRLYNGTQIYQDVFEIPNDQESLVKYCTKLGLPNTSMVE